MAFEKEEGLIECGNNIRFGASRFGWVRNAPMEFLGVAGENWAGFSGGFIADGDNQIKRDVGHVMPGLAVWLPGINAMSL